MKVWVLLSIMWLAMVGMFLPTTEAVCLWRRAHCRQPGDRSCQYEGWEVESGSEFRAPFPFCEFCSCNDGQLSCCGYGRMAYDIVGMDRFLESIGCKSVDTNSCYWKFLDINDETKPCPYYENMYRT